MGLQTPGSWASSCRLRPYPDRAGDWHPWGLCDQDHRCGHECRNPRRVVTQMLHLDPSLPGLLGAVTPPVPHTKSDLCSASSSGLDVGQQGRGREGGVMTTASLNHLPIIPSWEDTVFRKGPRELSVCTLLSRLSIPQHPAWTTTSSSICNSLEVIPVACLSSSSWLTVSHLL